MAPARTDEGIFPAPVIGESPSFLAARQSCSTAVGSLCCGASVCAALTPRCSEIGQEKSTPVGRASGRRHYHRGGPSQGSHYGPAGLRWSLSGRRAFLDGAHAACIGRGFVRYTVDPMVPSQSRLSLRPAVRGLRHAVSLQESVVVNNPGSLCAVTPGRVLPPPMGSHVT